MLNFIPNIGPLIAVLLPGLVIILDVTVTKQAAVVAMLVPAVLHVSVGNLLEPLLFGRNFQLNPAREPRVAPHPSCAPPLSAPPS